MSSLLVRRRGKKAGRPAALPDAADGAPSTGAPHAGGQDRSPATASSSGSGSGGDSTAPPQVVEWSGGPALLTKAWGALLALALLAGPAALVWTALRPEPAPVTSANGAVDQTASSAASERAVELVETWLRADSDDQQLIASLTNASVGSLPQEGLTIRDSSVAQVAPAEDDVWSVTVGVDVAEPAPGSAPPAAGKGGKEQDVPLVWVRRYYQVPVVVQRAETEWSGPRLAVTALALPAPVPGPAAAAEPPDLDYPETISPTSEAGQSVSGFLTAMVAGDGDISRYLRPGTNLSAVRPAPYAGVTVTDIKGSHEIAVKPNDGDGTHALTTVELERLDGEKTTAQYVLTLMARDGRWEVAGLEPAVRISTTPPGTIDSGTAGE